MRNAGKSVQRLATAAAVLMAAGAHGATVDDLVITEVDPVGNEVEVTNTSTEPFTAPNDLPFCHLLNYTTVIPDGTMFDPGESLVFEVTGLADSEGDVWLYRNDNDFGDPANIVTGMQYGGPNQGQTSTAVSAGIWTSTDDYVDTPAGGESMQLLHFDPTTPESWTSREATLGEFFGTGEQINDPIPEPIAMGTIPIELELVVDGLVYPLGVVEPDDGSGRLFVTDQVGYVHIVENGNLLAEPFLDVSDRIVEIGAFGPGTFDERGLLGFALHPDFANNGRVYTYTSEPVNGPADFTAPPGPGGTFNHQAVYAEWEVDPTDPDSIDPGSRRELLRIDQPRFNHNGGAIHFGPDGFLYLSLGDGGGADDPDNNAQNPENILGTLLRIDPDGDNSANGQYGIPAGNPFVGEPEIPDEIYVFGLRNPYLFSFDRDTGEMWIADVGQNDIEEVNRDIVPGGNYGWRIKEGSFFFDPDGGFVTTLPVEPVPEDLIDPFAEYSNPDEGIAIIGGFVYRGSAIPQLEGMYVAGDWSSSFSVAEGRLFYVNGDGTFFQLNPEPMDRVVLGFGEDLDGELYIGTSTETTPSGTGGAVFRIVPDETGVEGWLSLE